MTAIKRPLPASPVGQARSRGRLPAELADAARLPERIVFALPLAVGLLGIVVGLVAMFTNDTDAVMGLLLGLLGVTLGAAVAVRRARTGRLDRLGTLLAVAAAVAAVVVTLLPVWMYGFNINGIVHRTVVSGPLLLVLGTVSAAYACRRLLGTSPSGEDAALVPILAVPMVLGLLAYLVVLGRIVISGLGSFNLGLLTTAWQAPANGSPMQIGFLNNIAGTFLLIALTLVIAIVPGVGAGVLMSEYPGRMAKLVGFCTTMLRAMAMFIIGAAAFGVVRLASGLDSNSFLSMVIRGGFYDGTTTQPERGSFVMAAVFLAMLVMPVIARLTEQGLRSVPREMREGSLALGSTDGYGLRRILLPWAAPNILTALILAGAEAAGGLAIVMFVAGTGQHGIGPLSGATTLDFAVFATHYGPREYVDAMKNYQFTAALLLLVLTVGLTLIAMVLQQRFARRYRGSITAS